MDLKGSTAVASVMLFIKFFQHFFDRKGTLKRIDQVAGFIIEGKEGQGTHIIERWEHEADITAHGYILVSLEIIVRIEFLHLVEWHGSGHYDLDLFELIDIPDKLFCFMLAMITFRAEEHE